jgi:hypothetical protein
MGATAIPRIDPLIDQPTTTDPQLIDLLITIDPHMPMPAGGTVRGACGGAGDGVVGRGQRVAEAPPRDSGQLELETSVRKELVVPRPTQR